MLILLTTIHVAVCLFLILVVLLQQGKGADLSVFGGGSTQAVFGARGAATLLHKLTVGAFVAFIVTTIGIGLVNTGASSSIMRDVPVAEEGTAADEAGDDAESTAAPAAAEANAAGEGEAATPGEAATGDDADTPADTPADAIATEDEGSG